MGDADNGASLLKLVDGFLNFRFRVGIKGGGGFVEDKNGSCLVKGAGRAIQPRGIAPNSQSVYRKELEKGRALYHPLWRWITGIP